MSWKYNDGNFYVLESGYGMFYIEVNPCRCCPNSYMVEKRTLATGKKNVAYTGYFNDNIPDLKSLEKFYSLRKLD